MKTFKQYVEEEVKAADKKPVVVPAHKDAHGNTIPAKTVLRRSGREIVNKGNNPYDGQ